MNEENPKNEKVKVANDIFENRNVNRRSGPQGSFQKPLTYPSGYKSKPIGKPSDQPSTGKFETQRPLNSDFSKPKADSNVTPIKPPYPEPVIGISRPSGISVSQKSEPLLIVNVPTVESTTPITVPELQQPTQTFSSMFVRKASDPKPESGHLDREKVSLTASGPVKRRNMEVTRRDLEIMQFALEMKFISREDVFEKYFSVLKNNEPAKSNLWALERLAKLEKAGYLKRQHAFSENTIYYLATEKAYDAVLQRIIDEKIPKVIRSIDQRIFLHDKLVLKSRLQFEKHNPGCLWISDRKLRSGIAAMFSLPSAYVPDAVYELASGERVAFELENAMKGKSAYREKINFFVNIIGLKKNEPGMFTRVAFRCVRDDVYQKLLQETKIHGELFTVELWKPDFLNQAEDASEILEECEA